MNAQSAFRVVIWLAVSGFLGSRTGKTVERGAAGLFMQKTK